MGPQLVDALEDECDDAVAALAWVKEQPMVDAARVAMIGSSYGGVMVMLAARRRAAFRAGVSFAGPSITWPDAPALQDVLLDAMRTTEVPLFLVQAADDVHLAPTYALSPDGLVLSTAPAGLAPPAGTIAAAPAFRATIGEVPEEAEALLFVDLRQLLALGEQTGLTAIPGLGTARDDLARVRAAGLTVAQDPARKTDTTAELFLEIP